MLDDDDRETRDGSEIESRGGASRTPVPGLVLVFAGRTPQFGVVLLRGRERVLGRGDCEDVTIDDTCMSRQHAKVRFNGLHVEVCDLGSRNGSFVDGVQAKPNVWVPARGLVRMGHSLFLPALDVRRFIGGEVQRTAEGRVLGPISQAVAAAVARAGQFGNTLHLHGESGAGKEGAARLFHAASQRAGGPFVAVNCAAIPEGIAERLLFGARKGAFSGADRDSEGYIQAADGGTLFLDEVADLDLLVQGKLLRVLESKEVLALGATRPRPVDLRVVSATHKDLRAEVAAGRLREDLYFRIGRPEVAIPPLRERREEIPWLIQAALREIDPGLAAAVSLVEMCLLRRWPGNIRELLTEIRVAAHEALAARSSRVEAGHLAARAGLEFAAGVTLTATAPPNLSHGPPGLNPAPTSAPPSSPPSAPSGDAEPVVALPDDPKSPAAKQVLANLLRRVDGNVSKAARLLGIHRTQLRRLLAFHELDADPD